MVKAAEMTSAKEAAVAVPTEKEKKVTETPVSAAPAELAKTK